MNTFMKGMTAGLAVGATAAAVIIPKTRKSKKMVKTSTGRALKAVGSLIDNFQNMID